MATRRASSGCLVGASNGKRSKHHVAVDASRPTIHPLGPNKEGTTTCSWYNLEEDLENVVIGYLQYHDALAFSISCHDFLKRELHIHNITTVNISTNQGLNFFHQLTQGSKRAVPSKSMRNVTTFELYKAPLPSTREIEELLEEAQENAGGNGDNNAGGGIFNRCRPSEMTLTQRLPRLLKGFRFFFPSLIQLDLGGCQIGVRGATELAAGLKGMNGWPTLRHVNLRENDLCSLSFQRLAQAFDAAACPQLEYINVENNRIRAEGLTETEAILPPGLKYLNFRDNEIGDEGLSQLAVLFEAGGCPMLETLYVGINGIGEEGLMDLNKALLSGNLKALTSIELSSNALAGVWVHDADMMGFDPPQENALRGFAAALEGGYCPGITILRLDDIDMSNNGLIALSNAIKSGYCQSLTHLNLEGNSIGDLGISALTEALETNLCLELKELILDNCENMTSASCRQFLSVLAGKCCLNLQTLSLRGLEINDLCARALARAISSGSLPKLQLLSLEYTNVRDGGMKSLVKAFSSSPCTHLHELKLRCSSVSNGGTRALMDLLIEGKPDIVLPALKEVDVRDSDIVNSEKLRRLKARLARARPCVSIHYY